MFESSQLIRKVSVAIAVLAVLIFSPAALAQSCCSPHGGTGCNNAECQSLICGQDPFCCNTQWDALCADAANTQCAVCGGSGCGPACSKTNVECLDGSALENSRAVGQFNPIGCTAFLIAEPNIAITNAHCNLGSPANWFVTFNFECDACENGGTKQPVSFGVQQVLLVDNPNDIMIIRLNGNPAGQFGTVTFDPDPVSAGTQIYEVHHAEGQVKGVDFGQVLNPNVSVPGCPGSINEMAVSVIASQGASGSPVFRQDNHAVTGICNCGPPCSEGFVLPMSTIFPAIEANANANNYALNIFGVNEPPPNNTCGNSIFLSSDGSWEFTNVAATTDGPSESCPGTSDNNVQADVWFSYIASCTGDLTFSLCDSDYNTKMAIYAGSCPTSPDTALACDHNSCPASNRSELTLSVNQGDFLRIRIGGNFGAQGNGTLTISCAGAPDPTCEGNCGGQSPAGCWCDEECFGNGDCCDDVCEFCDDLDGCNSCQDICGDQAPGGCWCDAGCVDLGDCCNDACELCGHCEDDATCLGDLDGDGVVNVFDLLALLENWGSCPGCPADLNEDGVVNVFDLLILLENWGSCPS